jgi:hypothetical protein
VNASFDSVFPQKATTSARLELVQRLRSRMAHDARDPGTDNKVDRGVDRGVDRDTDSGTDNGADNGAGDDAPPREKHA